MRGWIATLVLLAAAGAARGQTLATQAIDLDNDGVPDGLTIEHDGRLVVTTPAHKTVEARFDTPGWRLGAAQIDSELLDGHRVILARATYVDEDGAGGKDVERGPTEALALEWRAGNLTILWHGTLGSKDIDNEWRTQMELTKAGLFSFQVRDDVRGCDGQVEHLFVERWDFAAKKFRAVSVAPAIAADAPVIAATHEGVPAGLTVATRPSVFHFEAATSNADDGGSAEGVHAPVELEDGDPKTAWTGARGATVIARGNSARYKVLALRILPGDSASRPKRLGVHVGTRAFAVEIPGDPGSAKPYWAILPEPVAASCVDVSLEARAAIAELAVLTDLEAGGEVALAELAQKVVTGAADANEAEHLLAAHGAAGAKALVVAAKTPGAKPEEQRRARLALARIGNPAGANEVALAIAQTTDSAEARRLAEGLRAMGAPGAGAATGLLLDENAPEAARALAAQVAGAVGGAEAVAALVKTCGHGPNGVRRAVVLALATRPVAELDALIGAIDGHATAETADLWHAVGLGARHAQGEARRRAAEAIATHLGAATDYELRYRLSQAAGGLADEPATARAVMDLLANEKEPAIRQVAVEQLPAGPLAVTAMGDADPGVRAAALGVIAAAGDLPDTDAAVLLRMTDDRWPLVRRAAADALAPRCARAPVADGLYAAARTDRDEQVRRTALAGLVRCKEPRVGAELVAIARDPRFSPSLRAHAASLLGGLGDRAQAGALVEILIAMRQEALESDASLRIAAAAAHALGELEVKNDKRVASALMDAAEDASFPVLQAAAIGALGRLCPPGVASFLARAKASDDSLVIRAARMAEHQCAGGGSP